jgi:hypothetical protein
MLRVPAPVACSRSRAPLVRNGLSALASPTGSCPSQVLTGVQTLDVLSALSELGIAPLSPQGGRLGGTLHSPSAGNTTPPPPGLLPAMFKRLTSELPSASGGQLAGLLQVTGSSLPEMIVHIAPSPWPPPRSRIHPSSYGRPSGNGEAASSTSLELGRIGRRRAPASGGGVGGGTSEGIMGHVAHTRQHHGSCCAHSTAPWVMLRTLDSTMGHVAHTRQHHAYHIGQD